MASPCRDTDAFFVGSSRIHEHPGPIMFGHLADLFCPQISECSCPTPCSDDQFSESDHTSSDDEPDEEIRDESAGLCNRCRGIDFSKAWEPCERAERHPVYVRDGKHIATLDPIAIPEELADRGLYDCLSYLGRRAVCPLCCLIYEYLDCLAKEFWWKWDELQFDARMNLYAFPIEESSHVLHRECLEVLPVEWVPDLVILSILPDTAKMGGQILHRVLHGGYLLCHKRTLRTGDDQDQRFRNILHPTEVPMWVDFTVARSWVSQCLYHHGDACNRMKRQSAGNSIERETSLNFRLIDCKTRRLVSASPRLKYTALSYVWERGIAGSLHFHEAVRIGDIVPKSLLSPGIEDGLRATQALGYRYFWVDKICIDQTSDEDKRTQIAMMGDIYQRAELTLVLASGNESERIPGVGLRRRRHPWLTLGDYSLIQMPGEGFEMLRFSTLRRRGWTLQEEILSRRTLYFLRNQIMLVCNQAYWYEVSVNVAEVQVHNSQRNIDEQWTTFLPPESLPLSGDILQTRGQFTKGVPCYLENRPIFCSGKPGCLCRPGIYYTLRTLWKLIEAYTDRHLSDDSDTLRAVEGCLSLASTFQHPVKHILGVGVPEISQSYELRSYFTAGLCWFHFFGRLSRLAGPTWTWAGWRVCWDPNSWRRLQILHPVSTFSVTDPKRIERSPVHAGFSSVLFFNTFLDNVSFEITDHLVWKWRRENLIGEVATDPTGSSRIGLADIPEIKDNDRTSVLALSVAVPIVQLSAIATREISPGHLTLIVGGYEMSEIQGRPGNTLEDTIELFEDRFRSGNLRFLLMGVVRKPSFVFADLSDLVGSIPPPKLSPLFIMVTEPVQTNGTIEGNRIPSYRRVTMLVFEVPQEDTLERICSQCQAQYQQIRLV